ncbi:hypothetical protein JJB07_03545 [Tumebacillus sp. ITR2]|uniref:Uncharacterized protein n=1 Tax=Tumebacillus amylolyticus TaxID=2801339 RepID=A0ABS1J606_9BACL|nr:hypothetical protein [Tumebacillus amylolyticus]MBL0385716.1 hypothetical protein [Tumebacillus amylolyticus]
MKKVSFDLFLETVQERRLAHGLRSTPLQGVTFLHDLSPDAKQNLDILDEVAHALKLDISRHSLKADYLSPYLRYNLQDLYDAFVRHAAERAFQRSRKYWYAVAFALAGVTLYEFFVEVAVLQCILLATITSGIFQYLRGGSAS